MERTRLWVVAAILDGRSPADVACEAGLSLRCVYGWMATYRLNGEESLRTVRRAGRPAKYSQELFDKTLALMEQQDLVTSRRNVWTTKSFGEAAAKAAGCVVSRSVVQRLLSGAGIDVSTRLDLDLTGPEYGGTRMPDLLDFVLGGGRSAVNEVWFGPVPVTLKQEAHCRVPRSLVLAVRAPRAIHFQIVQGQVGDSDLAGFVCALLNRSQKQLVLVPDAANCQSAWIRALATHYGERLVVISKPSTAATAGAAV